MTAPLAKPRPDAPPAIPELARAQLVRRISLPEGELPAGTRGTIVHVYRDGLAYEIEIQRPFHVVTTVEAADVVRA